MPNDKSIWFHSTYSCLTCTIPFSFWYADKKNTIKERHFTKVKQWYAMKLKPKYSQNSPRYTEFNLPSVFFCFHFFMLKWVFFCICLNSEIIKTVAEQKEETPTKCGCSVLWKFLSIETKTIEKVKANKRIFCSILYCLCALFDRNAEFTETLNKHQITLPTFFTAILPEICCESTTTAFI